MKRKKVYRTLAGYLEDFARDGGNQAAFAAKMGMSPGYLSDLKNGRVGCSLPLADRLSKECGIPIESFLRADSQAEAS